MKHYRVALQDGLNDLKELLLASGFEIALPGLEMQAEITIIAYEENNAFEEISPARITYRDHERNKRILIDASNLTPEQVLELIAMDWKKSVH